MTLGRGGLDGLGDGRVREEKSGQGQDCKCHVTNAQHFTTSNHGLSIAGCQNVCMEKSHMVLSIKKEDVWAETWVGNACFSPLTAEEILI